MSGQPRSGHRVLSIDSETTRSALRAGASGVGAIRLTSALLIALLVLVAAGTWWATRASGDPDPGRATGSALAASPDREPEEPRPGASGQQGRTPLAVRGRIEGIANVPPGVPFPGRWELRLRPARYQAPRGTLEKTLFLEDGEREFRIEEIPFGAYELLAVADGMNALPHPVLLEAESARSYVSLLLTPAGTLSGQLLHADGTGMDRIELRIVDIRTEGVRSVRTDLSGSFRFEGLLDGEYELHYGQAVNPLLDPRRLSFRAPSMQLPPVRVEGIAQVTLEVVDEYGNPLDGVQLTGSGSRGGTIDVTSDVNGMGWVSGLPSGRYRIWAAHPELGKELQVFELTSGEHAAVRFVFAP